MKSKVDSPATETPPNGALMLGPALQQSQRRLPLAGGPFLRLGDRRGAGAQDAVPGRRSAPATPWPTPRWTNWPDQGVAPAQDTAHVPAAPPVGGTGRVTRTGPQPAVGTTVDQDLAALTALVPALTWVRGRSGVSKRAGPDLPRRAASTALTWSLPAQLAPASVGILNSALSGQTPFVATRETAYSSSRVSLENAPAISKGTSPGGELLIQRLLAQTVMSASERSRRAVEDHLSARTSQDVGKASDIHALLLATNPSTHPLPIAVPQNLVNVLPGVAPSQQRPSPPSGMVPSLPQRTPHADHPLGPYAPTPLHGLTMVTKAVERLVERKVTTEVKRQQKEIETQARNRDNRDGIENRPPLLDITSDEVVRKLMQKMRALSQQERFRLGRLR